MRNGSALHSYSALLDGCLSSYQVLCTINELYRVEGLDAFVHM